MSIWPKDELQKIAEADDLHMAPFREDGVTYGTPTWIWSVFLALALAMFLNQIACGAGKDQVISMPPARKNEESNKLAEDMSLRITIGEKVVTATLTDNETARDFVSLLPLTLTLKDYNETEKISDLPRRLSTKGAPTYKGIAYASSGPADGQGHLLDIYLPQNRSSKVPVVIFTHGSGWMMDNGRDEAQALAAVLNPKGYAVAGVAVRSRGQTTFPGQLHDIKAAIRWLRKNSDKYSFDSDRIGIVGDSSGGWTSAMAAVTSDEPKLEGAVGTTGVSSAVQAAIAFYPPTDLLQMDAWALRPCDKKVKPFGPGFCHLVPGSPESLFLGCVPSDCPDKAALANPINHVSVSDPPLMIIHGQSDQMVNHAQGEALYQALNKSCNEAVFISLPLAEHGGWSRMMTDPKLAYGATIRSTSKKECQVVTPQAVTLSWDLVIGYLDKHLKGKQ
jgi:acetyl esterase/lipase